MSASSETRRGIGHAWVEWKNSVYLCHVLKYYLHMRNLYKSQNNVHEGKTHSKLRCLCGLLTHKTHMIIME